ncbi:undecaprenyl-diphosphate phosphatase [Sulfurovum sp. bin170]|uniref:undecaprenyl-diphosphate phosphatase n=1 Tax=Sulfurovum sp. bin170 TaxID=2695268 RepID=UPI0013DF6201|nr:undecaprenyl-diphosphate phosphatase [Sulfurovum sp. bin170]NEW59695.1 undecaprenyl-diphosphate phosphatase [Sulfurovum sp. bin170]
MDILQAIIIGIIEGFTEFLPISSTGHMIVASEFLGIEQTAVVKAYEVIIQFAAILAVMLLYREKINLKEIELWKKLFVAFLPIAIVGFLCKDWIKEIFTISTVAWMFIVGGIVFLVVEYFYEEEQSHTTVIENVSWSQSIWIGLAQILSLVPGTSRAGATIIGGLLLGLDRKTSAEFSFLLAIPVMMAVSGYDLLKHYDEFIGADLTAFVVGFVVAFVVAYLTIKLFIVFLQRFTFVAFGIYRILFGVFLLMIM